MSNVHPEVEHANRLLAMKRPEGRFRCLACGYECDGTQLVLDPQRYRWTCADYCCGASANVRRIQEPKPDTAGTRRDMSANVAEVMSGFQNHLSKSAFRAPGMPPLLPDAQVPPLAPRDSQRRIEKMQCLNDFAAGLAVEAARVSRGLVGRILAPAERIARHRRIAATLRQRRRALRRARKAAERQRR